MRVWIAFAAAALAAYVGLGACNSHRETEDTAGVALAPPAPAKAPAAH